MTSSLPKLDDNHQICRSGRVFSAFNRRIGVGLETPDARRAAVERIARLNTSTESRILIKPLWRWLDADADGSGPE